MRRAPYQATLTSSFHGTVERRGKRGAADLCRRCLSDRRVLSSEGRRRKRGKVPVDSDDPTGSGRSLVWPADSLPNSASTSPRLFAPRRGEIRVPPPRVLQLPTLKDIVNRIRTPSPFAIVNCHPRDGTRRRKATSSLTDYPFSSSSSEPGRQTPSVDRRSQRRTVDV